MGNRSDLPAGTDQQSGTHRTHHGGRQWFVYYVSLKGVTGAANLSLDSVREKLAEIRSCTIFLSVSALVSGCADRGGNGTVCRRRRRRQRPGVAY